jgi:hypothetical protein
MRTYLFAVNKISRFDQFLETHLADWLAVAENEVVVE